MISPIFKAKILSIDPKNNIDSSYTKFKIFKSTFYMVSGFSLKRVKYTTFALDSPGVHDEVECINPINPGLLNL